jgi:hypothetical protein
MSKMLKPTKQILMGNTKIPGVGLWCTEKSGAKEDQSIHALSVH